MCRHDEFDILRRMSRRGRSRSPRRSTAPSLPLFASGTAVLSALDSAEAGEALVRSDDKPSTALKMLDQQKFTTKPSREWVEAARIRSILGSCGRSLSSVRSGLKLYIAFIRTIAGAGAKPFPPRVEWLQAWASLFRCTGTFSNYIGYVRTGCLLVKADVTVFGHPALRRAKA